MPISQIVTNSIANGAVVPADLSTGAPSWNSSGQVGINKSNPAATLDVNGFVYLQDPNNAVLFSNGGGGAYFFRKGNVSSYTDQMVIDSAGRVTTPFQPRVYAKLSGNITIQPVVQTTVIPYNSVITNIGNNYNSSTGLFTAPVAGTYMVFFGGYSENGTPFQQSWFVKNGLRDVSPNVDHTSANMASCGFIELNANDTLGVHLYNTNSTQTLTENQYHTFLSIRFIG